ncbi:flavin reductase (DIM6/NTAB) family NADH-FMN oxidoreductase RutF [Evansella vedderi]|uniref:Flavin reductase (DIM6/NTAB) family NADH-FMN oxidoreductase RutF n=1 Tax=Evansella vedderi TaxID=38282 RepID=A0ABU0A2C8_9BACI|nr:flavin reductase family protein [Evansella vedderi]MDQ0257111.1 flavin reductase (DIM6/NTAB) family NADH-FMN oxidoreductase RutF [Evansella vedderi]
MDDRQFRNAMGKFATGVTVVTTELNGEVHGMTANAFMSVSLDPKLVVVSIGERARLLPKLKEANKFTVNILASDQQEISMIFAGQLKDQKKTVSFERLEGQAVIPGALAQVVCEVSAEHVEGDHTLFIGKVIDIRLEEGDPLVFFSGRYRTLAEETN